MRDVVIAGYLRTAQSRSRPNDPERDWLHSLRSDEMLAQLLPELLKRSNVDPNDVDDFIVGSAQGVHEQWSMGGRIPILLANLPETIAAKSVDQQCGSAMAAVQIGALEIQAGMADIVMCGGMEHMTRVPMGGNGAISMNTDLFTEETYKHWDMATAGNMGLIAEAIAEDDNTSRERMDEWGVRSHQRAAAAQESGFFTDEILPLEARQGDGSTMVVDKDQAVRGDTTMEGMAGLRTPFKEDGKITPGNASPLNAGATSMLLMAREEAEKRGIKPMAVIKAMATVGVPPNRMGIGPVPASQKALELAGLKAEDIDVWEINEAFSVVAIHAIDELGIDPEKVNIHGGGIAIGHPLGATGIRILGTCARILEETGGRYGCATACIGGGQGIATIIEREA
jgi:acetyl-CoA acyltransferase